MRGQGTYYTHCWAQEDKNIKLGKHTLKYDFCVQIEKKIKVSRQEATKVDRTVHIWPSHTTS